MFKKKKDYFSKAQSLNGKLRIYSKRYMDLINKQLEEYGSVDPESKKMLDYTVTLLNESCKLADSYLSYEKERKLQMDRIEEGIETIKGLLK